MSEPEPGFVQVKIYDRDYALRTTGDPERLHRICVNLDKRMREIAESSGTVDTLKLAILVALSLADDLDRDPRRAEEDGRFPEPALSRVCLDA